MSGPAPRFLERAVHYNNISPKLAKRLEARSRELAMDALKTANREANRALAKDKGGDARWNFGIYIYSEDADDEARGKDATRKAAKRAAPDEPAASDFTPSAADRVLARRNGDRARAGQARHAIRASAAPESRAVTIMASAAPASSA